ncbi:MAG: hypothetical protein AAF668_14335 [Pseudomonadota bacterium]
MKLAISIAITVAVLGALGVPATAQDASKGAKSTMSDEVVCMARARDNSPQVRVADRGKLVFVAVLPRAVPGLEGRGFSAVECSAAGLQSPSDFVAYRDRVCEAASMGNVAVQEQIARALGEYPSVLCAYAERISGRWERKAQDRE